MENNQSIFEVKNVDLFYGEHQALKSINLNIEKNKVTAFIGPSGCGKSTLLRCFNKMNDLISGCKVTGEIIFDGTDINLMNTIEFRTKYGPRCSGIKNKEKLKEIVIDSLKKASLYEEVKDRLKSSALSLSGGQQQRLCIARAIAMKPEVILMDEPTSALDPIATLKIEELILELKKNYTIVIVTHNMQQATRISDYTAFFLLGEMIEMDKTNELFSNPKNKKTEDYITGRFG